MNLCHFFQNSIFTARKRSLWRLCFYRYVSGHRGEGMCYPSTPCSRSRGGGGIPVCLAGLQAHTQGGSLGGFGGGVSRPTPKAKLRGIWSRPIAKGEVEGDLFQAHSQGGSWGGSGPGPHPRGKLRGIWPGGCLLRGWRPPVTATAAGGMHPTGMHSCPEMKLSIITIRTFKGFVLFQKRTTYSSRRKYVWGLSLRKQLSGWYHVISLIKDQPCRARTHARVSINVVKTPGEVSSAH